MYRITKTGIAALLIAFSFFISSCALFQTQTDETGSGNPFLDKLDVDPETGVIYRVPQDDVLVHILPDGSRMEIVKLPPGEFIMGNDNVDPFGIQNSGRIRVGINGFYMSRHEVTNEQYRGFLESLSGGERDAMMPDSTAWNQETGSSWSDYFWSDDFNDYPVAAVTWEQAKAFAEWAGMRLPTESEWEYAARSGSSGNVFPWEGLRVQSEHDGRFLANFAPHGDYGADGYVLTAPVGSFPANSYRLKDMAGNVAEWVQDTYTKSYQALAGGEDRFVSPVYEHEEEPRRVVRGGSWASSEFYIGVGVRDFRNKDHASARIGFRVAHSGTAPVAPGVEQEDVPEFTPVDEAETDPGEFEEADLFEFEEDPETENGEETEEPEEEEEDEGEDDTEEEDDEETEENDDEEEEQNEDR